MHAYFVLRLSKTLQVFPALFASGSAKHCCWHRNFQLSTHIFHGVLEFFICWINEATTSKSSGIVKLRFFDSPLLLRFASLCFLLHQTCASTFLATKGRRLLSCQSRADHVYPPGGFPSDIVSET